MQSAPIIEVFHRGTHWLLIPGGTDFRSWFGGPHKDQVASRVDLERAVLHHIATLNLPMFGVGNSAFGFSVPLFYGICHEGCELEYRKTAVAAVEIMSLDPGEAEVGYPYHGYPALLPYYSLGIGASNPYESTALEERIDNTGWSIRNDCLYAIVMQHPNVGHCLFGAGTEDVEIVFEYDPKKGTIRAVNHCG